MRQLMCASSAQVSPGSPLPICLPKLGSPLWCSTTAASAADRRERRPPTSSMRSTIASSTSSGYHGERGSRLAAESHSAAIDRIESIVSRERIACDFTRLDGYLFLRPGARRGVSRSRARRGPPRRPAQRRQDRPRAAVVRYRPVPALSEPGAVSSAEISRRPRRGDRARRRPHLHRHARHKIEGGARRRRDGDAAASSAPAASSSRPTCRSTICVVVHTKQAPYMTYVIGAPVPRDSVTTALYWDTGDPYHYMRLVTAIDADSRSADRRRRGSQERPGRRHRRAASAPRSVGARALSR